MFRETDKACIPRPLLIHQPICPPEGQDLHPHVQGYPVPQLGRHRVVQAQAQAQAVCMVGRDYFEACEGLVRAEETSSLVLKQQKAMTEEPHLLSKD